MDLSNYESQMQKTINHLDSELGSIHLGRASTGLVEQIDIFVPSYGMKQPLNQLANATILDAQTIKIEPWDKSILAAIEKGIYDADMGLTPQNMGDYIIINIPPMTQERRQEITKVVSRIGEEAKVSIRNIRHDAMKMLKTSFEDKEISEDEKNAAENKLDEITKNYNEKIEKRVKAKSDDIMQV